MPQSPTPPPRLKISNASKTFGHTAVLTGVGLEVRPGEIHGLVGQNGSGKSTLIKLLSGFHTADPGSEFEIDGTPLSIPIRPSELQRHGLSFVHQDLGLVSDASVVENVKIGRYSVGAITRRIKWQRDAEEVARVLATLGAGNVDPYAAVATLSHGARASVAIARAILGLPEGSGCIVFDESTQSLPREILHEFYAQVRKLAESGTSVLIVSHRLDEILALCQRVTVLEDGHVTVEGLETSGLTETELTRLILGKSHKERVSIASDKTVKRIATSDKPALKASELSGGRLLDVSFEVGAGEIVGAIGNSESGYDELPYVLSGSGSKVSGTLSIAGTPTAVASLTPSRAIALGVCFVPGRRAEEGLALSLLAFENVSLPRIGAGLRKFFLGRRWQEVEFHNAAANLGITPAAPSLPTNAFSGGNQQKLLLSKWLLNRPKMLVLHEPTQAVDVGARTDILAALREEAQAGMGVLVCSLETDDLASICDRVLVFRDGRIHRELTGASLTAHAIIDAAYGVIDSELQRIA